jgi:hypothetical protein
MVGLGAGLPPRSYDNGVARLFLEGNREPLSFVLCQTRTLARHEEWARTSRRRYQARGSTPPKMPRLRNAGRTVLLASRKRRFNIWKLQYTRKIAARSFAVSAPTSVAAERGARRVA